MSSWRTFCLSNASLKFSHGLTLVSVNSYVLYLVLFCCSDKIPERNNVWDKRFGFWFGWFGFGFGFFFTPPIIVRKTWQSSRLLEYVVQVLHITGDLEVSNKGNMEPPKSPSDNNHAGPTSYDSTVIKITPPPREQTLETRSCKGYFGFKALCMCSPSISS